MDIRNKIVLKEIGNPKAVLASTDPKAKHILGTVFGIATSVKRVPNKADPTKYDESLSGDFETAPTDTANFDAVRSGKLFLPEGLHNMIASKLEGDNPAKSVQFAMEVATIKSTNAAGYTWSFTPKIESTDADPLKSIRDAVEQASPKQVAHKKDDKK